LTSKNGGLWGDLRHFLERDLLYHKGGVKKPAAKAEIKPAY
jgi:hypothetical protein